MTIFVVSRKWCGRTIPDVPRGTYVSWHIDRSYADWNGSSMRDECEESRQHPPLRGLCWMRGSKPRSAVRRSEQAEHIPGVLAVLVVDLVD